ncbi:polysaccharide biosynthesis/export family protein [Sphingomonas qilianensis]|uniref:Polysaccharide biosynthesis/export family protein n=1 Tax=Sphingomonas qilianensis TaxID=1736690 RepID=A0ABU9XP28_9SPHN
MFARMIAVLMSSATVAAVAAAQTPAPPAPMMAPADGYQLGINDEIEVTIFGQGQQAQITKTRVKEDGTVTLPLIGTVVARDLTARQLAESVTLQLRNEGFFTRPVVSVDVTQYVSNSVTIYGAVGSAGVFPLDRPLTVAMMLARAGGARADGADFVVLRRANDTTEHRIPVASFGGEYSSTTPLRAGDTLFVPVAPTIFVYGQVNSPGSFTITSGMTIRQVLARAGGPTLAGSERNISIYRGGERLKKVDLNSLAQEGDTLFIHEKLF